MRKSIFKKLTSLGCIITLGTALFSCSSKEQILIYCSSEEERIEYIQEELDKQFPQYEIVIQYLGTGQLVSKLQGEGTSTDCDIIYELEANNMELLLEQDENFFADLSAYDFSKFTNEAVVYSSRHKLYAPTVMTYGAVAVNNKVLNDKGLPAPTTYEDLLDPKYKDLISMPNPKSSGTGYLFYNGLVSALGETEALAFFNSLDSNIKEYTSSGSAPIKALNRGEIGIGFTMLWQAFNYKKDNADLDYTFLNYGSPSNLYVMTMIKGHETRTSVKEVFDYIYNDLNQAQTEKFIPDQIYKQQTPEDPNYPMTFNKITMNGLFNPSYKQDLLDKWQF